MNRRPTINDVAARAGVSKATVSAVLNQTSSVRDSTRQRVLEVIEELNFRPLGAPRRGAGERARSVGLVVREVDNPYYGDVIRGVRSVADQHGYTVLVASSEGRYEMEQQAIELLRDKEVDGLILYPVLTEQTDLSHLFELKRRSVPFVLLEGIWGVQASLIGIDNAAASRRAVEYLLSLGHTRIVHFAGPEYSMHGRERIDGVFRAFSGSRIPFTDESVIRAGAHLEDGYRAGMEFFRNTPQKQRPTAVTCYNDMVALGLLRALSELGIGVPEDVSVIGYDNLEILDYLAVPLTSVHVPKYEIGQRAMEILVEQVEAAGPLPPRKLQFEAGLVVRRSTRSLLSDRAGEEDESRAVAGGRRH